jgi:hypothetical protein
MMLKLIPLTALALGLSSGVALADHRDHRGDGHRDRIVVQHGGPNVRDHRGGTVVVRDHGWHNGGNRVIVRNGYRGGYGYHSVRRPIFVSRPVIHARYYNYYRRPAVLVENYAPMAGYYWVPGAWSWTGYEWTWTPGHYQPDPNYVESYYNDDAYYDNGY